MQQNNNQAKHQKTSCSNHALQKGLSRQLLSAHDVSIPHSASGEDMFTMLSFIWNSGVFYNSWLFAMHERIMRGAVVSSCQESRICGMVLASIEKARVRRELRFGHFLPALVSAFAPETAAVMKREI